MILKHYLNVRGTMPLVMVLSFYIKMIWGVMSLNALVVELYMQNAD